MRRDRLFAVIALGLVCTATCEVSAQPPRSRSRDFTISEAVSGSDLPLHLTFVLTKDFIHTPIAMRKPAGAGPFPAILFLAGSGGGGMAQARWAMLNRGYTMQRFLQAGYVVAFIRYRAEVPLAYRQAGKLEVRDKALSRPLLDHDDVMAVVQYVKRLPYVDDHRVGMMGVSHGGELIMKVVSEMDVAAAVCCEPASHEYLALSMDKLPRGEPQLQRRRLARQLADKQEAMSRIETINTPLLIVGRDGDHLQGVFELAYEWIEEAGKDVQWKSFDHPAHGFLLPRRKADGTYRPDEMQMAAIQYVLNFFEVKVHHR